jgi:hypothetical protein
MILKTRVRAWLARRYLAAVKRDIRRRVQDGWYTPAEMVTDMSARLVRGGWGGGRAIEVALSFADELIQEGKKS